MDAPAEALGAPAEPLGLPGRPPLGSLSVPYSRHFSGSQEGSQSSLGMTLDDSQGVRSSDEAPGVPRPLTLQTRT